VKIKGASTQDGLGRSFLFWCPGCKKPHPYRVLRHPNEPVNTPVWDFNGDVERPTFSPSLLVNASGKYGKRCHLFLTDGQLQFCSDSEHALAGQTVPCPDWDDERW
jgi:hypothetical protein